MDKNIKIAVAGTGYVGLSICGRCNSRKSGLDKPTQVTDTRRLH